MIFGDCTGGSVQSPFSYSSCTKALINQVKYFLFVVQINKNERNYIKTLDFFAEHGKIYLALKK